MRETNMERDLTLEELIQIGTQLFPDTDPNEIANAIEQIKASDSSITNADIVNMVVHMVIDKQGQTSPKLDNLRELMSKR